MKKLTLFLFLVSLSVSGYSQFIIVENNSPCDLYIHTLYERDLGNLCAGNIVVNNALSPASSSQVYFNTNATSEFVYLDAVHDGTSFFQNMATDGACTTCPSPTPAPSSTTVTTANPACPTIKLNWDSCANKIEFN